MENKRGDLITEYVLRVQPLFDLVSHAGAQLTAFLLLAATASRPTDPASLLASIAERTLKEAEREISALIVPPGCAHHMHHLLEASDAFKTVGELTCSLMIGRRCPDVNRALALMQTGWDALTGAAKVLPGFATFDVTLGCCAACRSGTVMKTAGIGT